MAITVNFNPIWIIRKCLILAFGALSAIVVAIPIFSALAFAHQQHEFQGFIKGANARQMVAAALRSAVDRRVVAVLNMVLVNLLNRLSVELKAYRINMIKHILRLDQQFLLTH